MSRPITAAAKAAKSTAPAARSFTWPAFWLYSGETRSTKNSSAVLNASATNTRPMAVVITANLYGQFQAKTLSRRPLTLPRDAAACWVVFATKDQFL